MLAKLQLFFKICLISSLLLLLGLLWLATARSGIQPDANAIDSQPNSGFESVVSGAAIINEQTDKNSVGPSDVSAIPPAVQPLRHNSMNMMRSLKPANPMTPAAFAVRPQAYVQLAALDKQQDKQTETMSDMAQTATAMIDPDPFNESDKESADWPEDLQNLSHLLAVKPNTYELYGRYKAQSYQFLWSLPVSQNLSEQTLWLNMDSDEATGFQWPGGLGGAEFNITLYPDGSPYLFKGARGQELIAGPLQYQSGRLTDKQWLAFVVPEGLLAMPDRLSEGIQIFTEAPGSSQYPLANKEVEPMVQQAAQQTAVQKQSQELIASHQGLIGESARRHAEQALHVGIVFSKPSRQYFWSPTAYSQLFMSVQSQVRMAGIPYDLLTENDLLDLSRLIQYDTLIFPLASHVSQQHLAAIERNLMVAVHQHGLGLITAGNFMTNQQEGKSIAGDAYARMKNLFGLELEGNQGPVAVQLKITDNQHPITAGYQQNEVVMAHEEGYIAYFKPTGNYPTRVLAKQSLAKGEFNALITSEAGGRHVHFGTLQHMADGNLLWPAVQWSVFGEKPAIALKMSRHNALFAARNDMDQSQYVHLVPKVSAPLLDLLKAWKARYDFVGSYYINVGNQPHKQRYTNWAVSGPLYQQYLQLENEIGTHSHTHPFDTNRLDALRIRFEFADSKKIIKKHLGLSKLGAAVPGATEQLNTSLEIIQHVDYLSGGFSGAGAGFPNAFGYLLPDSQKVYLSPNMSFDFTLIEFKKYNARQAEQIWLKEVDQLMKQANQAVLHWPWHDYAAMNTYNSGYTLKMFESLLEYARQQGVEFVTVADLVARIEAFHRAGLQVEQVAPMTLKVSANSPDSSVFALQIPDHYRIRSVDNWPAYNDQYVFLAKDNKPLTIHLSPDHDGQTQAKAVTRISRLPARARLLSVQGDGPNLEFLLKGQGVIEVATACQQHKARVIGGAVLRTESGWLEIELPPGAVRQPHELRVETEC